MANTYVVTFRGLIGNSVRVDFKQNAPVSVHPGPPHALASVSAI